MTSVAGISSITNRVSEILDRIAERTGAGANLRGSSEVHGPIDPTVGFDPFGEAYQQAVAAVAGGSGRQYDPSGGAMDRGVEGWMLQSASLGRAWMDQRAGVSGVGAAGDDSTVGQIGGYGRVPVPPELAMYGNGEVPRAALEPIGQAGHRLWAPAAESWRRAVAAAAADGVDLKVTDSYRTYDQQVDLAQRKGLYVNGGLAAVPGTSPHGWGIAVDVNLSHPGAVEWLRANGHQFGFAEVVPREPWHWEFRPEEA